MIIAVSIVDKHKPKGQAHVGTYMFEIDYPPDSHFDFVTIAAPAAGEPTLKPLLGRLLQLKDMPDPVNGRGEPVNARGEPIKASKQENTCASTLLPIV